MAISCAVVSACVWALPLSTYLVTGYQQSSQLTFTSVLFIFCWYSVIFFSLRTGELVGSHITMHILPPSKYSALHSTFQLKTLTILAIIGVGAAYKPIIGSLGLGGMLISIYSGVANELKEALYEEYSAGLASLRYIVTFSASLAIIRYRSTRRFDFFLFVNIALLILATLLSTRLLFVATVLTTIFLVGYSDKQLSVNIPYILSRIFVIFAVLTLFNASRNSNYYLEEGHGFWSAGLSSVVTYVGSPFQVLVAAADNPTYLVLNGPGSSRALADIDPSLTTNSAFVELHENFGFGAWPYISFVCVFMGFVFSICVRAKNSILLLAAAAVLYASAEIWRIDLFSKGVFVTWLAVCFVMPLIIFTFRSCFAFYINKRNA